MCYTTRFSDMCTHDMVTYDEHDGTVVCTDCALVLEENIADQRSNTAIQTDEVNDVFEEFINSEDMTGCYGIPHAKNYLYDVCQNLELSPAIYNEATRRAVGLWYNEQLPYPWKELSAYALYETMINNYQPIDIHSICQQCHISPHVIWKLDQQIGVTEKFVSAKSYVQVHCYFLDMNQEDVKNLEEICLLLRGFDYYHPKTVCAALIYIYSKRIGKPLDYSTISKLCNVSASSIAKLCKTDGFPTPDNIM